MAVIVWAVIIMVGLVGGWANWFIWSVTQGTASAWDVSVWPVLFHNILIDPLGFAQVVYVLAIACPFIAAFVAFFTVIHHSKKAAKRAQDAVVGLTRVAEIATRAAGRSSDLLSSGLGSGPSPRAASGKKDKSPFIDRHPRIKELADDIKAMFSSEIRGLKKGRERAVSGVGAAVGSQGILGRMFKRADQPEGNLLSLSAGQSAADPTSDLVAEIMEWWVVWEKQGPQHRTEKAYETAAVLKRRMTQQVQDALIAQNGQRGLAAVDALIFATMSDKANEAYDRNLAEAVEQPEGDDLIDDEIAMPRRAEGGFDDEHAPGVDEMYDDGSLEAEGGAEVQKQKFTEENIKEYFAPFDAPAKRAQGPDGDDGLSEFKKAGQGTAGEFAAAMSNGWSSASSSEDGNDGWGGDELSAIGIPGSDQSAEEDVSGLGDVPAWEQHETAAEGDAAPSGEEMPSWHKSNQRWKMPEGYSEEDGEAKTPAADDWNSSEWKDAASPNSTLQEGTADGSASWKSEEAAEPEAGVLSSVHGEPDEAPSSAWPPSSPSHVQEYGQAREPARVEVPSGSASWRSRVAGSEEDGAVDALLASVSPDGPIGDYLDEDFRDHQEDVAQSVSTRISAAEVERTIQRVTGNKDWLRAGTGLLRSGQRSLEREFIKAGLVDLKSRNAFIPALWSALQRVVDYQTQAYAWEHFGDVPPEELKTARQRAEFLFDAVTEIAALARQTPAADVAELLELKKGTEQARWLAAGRAERMVKELKRTGAVEPSRGLPADAPAEVLPVVEEAETRASERLLMAEAAKAMAGVQEEEREEPASETLPSYSEDELLDEGAEEGWKGDWPEQVEEPMPAEETKPFEDGRADFIGAIIDRARLDGLEFAKGLTFKPQSGIDATDEERTIDIVLGADVKAKDWKPQGSGLVLVNVVDVPDGVWIADKGLKGRPQLKLGGQVIDFRTFAFRMLENWIDGKGIAVKKVLLFRMSPVAMIEGKDGTSDMEAIAGILEGDIQARVQPWTPDEWRSQVLFHALS